MPRHQGDRAQVQRRLEEIRARIAAMEYVCSGTLLHRVKRCGKPSCRCARDPAALHGPYHEWSRWEDGKLVHTVLPADQAALVEQAIGNHREILELLHAWERETMRLIRSTDSAKYSAP